MTVTINSEPGLAELATTHDRSVVPYADAAAEFLDSLVFRSPVAVDFRDARRAATGETSESADWWEAVKDWFAPEYNTVVDTRDEIVELAAYYLVPPRVTDARVKLSVVRKDASETTASFTLAGTGGGPKFTVAVTTGITSYPTDTPRRAVLTARGVVQVIEKTKNGRVLGRYLRLVALDTTADDWTFPALPGLPPASILGPVIQQTDYHLVDAVDSTEVTHSIARGTELTATIGLKVESLGIEASTSLTTSYGSEISLIYTLPKGRDYESRLYERVAALFWTP